MSYPSGTYLDQITDHATRAEFDQLYALLQGYLDIQHKADGSHGDVTALSVSTTGSVTTDSDGHPIVAGPHLLVQSARPIAGFDITGGTHSRWRIGAYDSPTSSSPTREFLIQDLIKSPNDPYTLRLYYDGTNYVLHPEAGASLVLGADATGQRVTNINATAATLITGRGKALCAGTSDASNVITLSNGRNDNVSVGGWSFVEGVTGPTAAYQISGIVAGVNGQHLSIFQNSGQVLTLNHADANSTAANRIYCPGAANKALSATFGTALLQYNANIPGWIVLSVL